MFLALNIFKHSDLEVCFDLFLLWVATFSVENEYLKYPELLYVEF